MTYDEAYKLAKKHSELPVLITGPHGPTGKSTLCNKLREEGHQAYELWEFEEKGIEFPAEALVLILDEFLPVKSFHRAKYGDRSLMPK